jgi:hypothetical protein
VGADKKQLTVSAGIDVIKVRNVAGLNPNDFIILEGFESEDAEMVEIQSIDSYTHELTLVVPTAQDHSVGVIIIKTPYNQVKIYSGVTADPATHTEVTGSPFGLRPDNPYTVWTDPTGTPTTYYSYAYFNSAATIITDRALYADSDYDSVLTVDHLKNWFMFGLDLTDDDGYPFPNSMFEFAIRAAIDNLEKVIGVKLKPTVILQEMQDYFVNEYKDFAFIQLNEYPIVSVEQVSIQYPTAQSPVIFPVEWIQINKMHGQIHLIPTSGSLSQILMGTGGDYLNFVWRGWEFMPNLWRVNYTAGFPRGQVPNDLVGIVGRMACFYPLNIAGDLVGGIAIASKSIGIDGLSQSINTTSSPENAGYSARLRQYERELKIEIPRQVAFYKGLRMSVC